MDIILLRKSIMLNARFGFSRSGGKGGQNVNKVNTKVHASIAVGMLAGLTEDERHRLRSRLGTAVNKDGEIFVDVQDERFQERNRELALKRLEARVLGALAVKKRRIKTKPTRAAKERRLKVKKIASDRKNGRKKVIV
ncbi:MAG: alternative ribosome rescue aminoacyl-tRNA hydrolase ArfB [Treponema sp.]